MKSNKKQTIIALKKAQTNINTIISMVEKDMYCIDTIQQILAVNGLLKSSTNKILEEHLNTCFYQGIKTNNKETRENLIKELVDVFNLGNKSK